MYDFFFNVQGCLKEIVWLFDEGGYTYARLYSRTSLYEHHSNTDTPIYITESFQYPEKILIY